ncbi:4-hydroxy-tetrahydrodipicolinate reductase [Nonlabens tegetincola]|uniref:4-hydroxy-tetrahydrodipicolinate reductase n=1 Tax=Nonlabens tegetincola TaxID=323273 RepID=UPI000CF3E419|nr:4-hydroxy-tetrahydrodipicolinate reductase [Nonlabens tegetincola]PQJ18628.1 4-hydroxy-tetrahydrodipicolinate reductase [Nonlabens tegetincola]
MKIALVGYGKMGKTIERLATSRGHEIVARLGRNDQMKQAQIADVAIEFTSPESVLNNLNELIKLNIPTVCGTTGWNDNLDDISNLVIKENCSLVHASNFSLGVNLFFELNKKLAAMMSTFNEYKVSMNEIHHTEKKDAPSGTAITLFEGLKDPLKKTNWSLEQTSDEQIVTIDAIREEDVKGTHSIFYSSDIDEIEIKHTAHSRDGFALGAVIAAEWIHGKKGVFTMKDVLGL